MKDKDWYAGVLKKYEKDPEYWKEYAKLLADEFDIVQNRVLELESAMQNAVDYLSEVESADFIIDEFKKLLNKQPA